MKEIISAIVIQDKKALMVYNHENISFPGGTKESGESDLECLAREFSEEFSKTKLKNLRPYKNFRGISPRSQSEIEVRAYFAEIDGELHMPDGSDEDVKRAEWMTYPPAGKTAKVARDILESLHQEGYL